MAKFESWFPSGQFDARGAGGSTGLPDFRKRRAEEAEFYARYGMSPAEFKEAERLRGDYPGVLPAGQRPKGEVPPAGLTGKQQGVINRYDDFRSLVDTALGSGGRRGSAGGAGEDERKRLEAMLKMLYAIPTLTPQQEKMRIETERRWSALSGQPIPEGVAGSLPEKKSAWERFKGLFTSDDEEVRGGLQGLE